MVAWRVGLGWILREPVDFSANLRDDITAGFFGSQRTGLRLGSQTPWVWPAAGGVQAQARTCEAVGHFGCRFTVHLALM